MHITSPTRLSPAHLLLAIIVVAIWGSNFVVIRIGLNQFPPFTFATLRFLLASLPLLPFFRWPETDWKNVVVYGLLIGAGQFGLMLYAMSGDISPGLASVLIQTQAFFTVALAVYFAGERIGARNIFGLLLCAAGVTIVIFMGGGEASPIGVALVLGGAFCWAMGNIVARRAGPINALSLVAWSNIFAILPLAAMALLFGALWSHGPRVAFGVGAVGLGVGAGLGVVVLGKRSELDKACPDQSCPVSEQGNLDGAKALSHASTAALVIGGAAVAVGAVLLLLPVRGGDKGRKVGLRLGAGSFGVEGAF